LWEVVFVAGKQSDDPVIAGLILSMTVALEELDRLGLALSGARLAHAIDTIRLEANEKAGRLSAGG
jgi:hypothetical protein